ncbi:hypothetical protein ZWY2020_029877 [Hordeum vulgare]|nr:hypothetical protein ZWY2020_029877 [Hordeum vulgare]
MTMSEEERRVGLGWDGSLHYPTQTLKRKCPHAAAGRLPLPTLAAGGADAGARDLPPPTSTRSRERNPARDHGLGIRSGGR